jgi:cell wall-associated NlpC family hydrolase
MEHGRDERIHLMKPLKSREKIVGLAISLVMMMNIGPAQATESEQLAIPTLTAASPSGLLDQIEQTAVREELQRQQTSLIKQIQQAKETELRLQIVAEALTHVGQVPYVLTGSTPRGWDCSGFTRYVFAKFDIDLEHSAGRQSRTGTWTAIPQPGDLVSFERGKGIEHIGIYVGDGVIVESTVETYTTRVVKLEDAYPDRLGWNIRFNSVIGSGLF